MTTKVNFGMGGEFRIHRYDDYVSRETLSYDSGWFDNLIVDNGLLICTTLNNWWTRTYIGSDGTAPQITDTQMGALLDFSSTGVGSAQFHAGSPTYEFNETVVRRFPAGSGTGTIREVGIGSNDTGTSLFCRHNVSPAITKAANQIVDVTYRLTLWPPTLDVNGSSVVGGVTYNTITRILNIDAANQQVFTQFGPQNTNSINWRCYDGVLGAITDTFPQGNTGADGPNSVFGAAAQGSRVITNTWEVDEGNAPLGVRTATADTSLNLRVQTQYGEDPGALGNRIPKVNTQELILNWTLTWARR